MQAAYPTDEPARLDTLAACRILDTPPEIAFDRLVNLAARVLDVPMAAVSFVDHDRQWYKSSVGIATCELARKWSFCAHAILEDHPFVVPDASRDARFADNPMVTGEMGLRFYAGAVLRAADGQPLGALWVGDVRAREFDAHQCTILCDLAALVVDELALRTQHRLLGERTAEVVRVNEQLRGVIHERDLADEEKQRTESRFRQLFEHTSVAAFMHDVAGRLLDVNAAACTALGYPRGELLELRMPELTEPALLPAEIELWSKLRPGHGGTEHLSYRRKDGSLLPVEVRVSVTETPEGRRVLALACDMTARRTQEHLLKARARQQRAISRLGLRAVQHGITEDKAALDAFLAEALALLGETLKMDACNVLEALPERDLYAWRAVYGWPDNWVGTIAALGAETASLAGYTLLTREPTIVNDYHTERRFRVPPALIDHGLVCGLSVVIYTESDVPAGTLGVHSRRPHLFTVDEVAFLQAAANILGATIARGAASERVRQALHEAAAARQVAEQANAAKSEFLSRMSHELRTPLNAILGFGQLLELTPLAASDADSVTHILKAGRHLLGLIDEVLDISRVEAGELHLSLGQVNVGDLARECVSLVAQAALAGGVRCEVRVPPTPTLLQTDERRLRQVLLNLLSNAIKYNRPGGHVLVSTGQDAPGTVRIAVSDTGSGLGVEAVARLFVPFDRLGQESGNVEGTGLGLVVSRRLVEAMGGSLTVKSCLDCGSTFSIEMPLDQPAAGPPARPPAPCAFPPAIHPPVLPHEVPACARLLYIEDDESNREVLHLLLTRYKPGWKVTSACDGLEGLEAARQSAPDLILLDRHLPGLPGDKVLDELRRDPRTRAIPVIMLTADATAQQREQLLAQGADEYICKPFAVDDLLHQLDRVLSRAIARRRV